MLAAQCRALIAVNQEIAARCRSVPVLVRIATAPQEHTHGVAHAQASQLRLVWKWRPKASRLAALLAAPHQLGPFSIKLGDLAQAWPLIERMQDAALERRLLELLEAQQLELGRLEAKCVAAQPFVGKGRLPLLLRHPYVKLAQIEVRCANALGLAGYLLACAEAEVTRTHSHRDVACSWLAMQLFGAQLIEPCVRIASTDACADGIYLQHDGKLFVGLALRTPYANSYSTTRRVHRFRFEQLEQFHFGNLQVQEEETRSAKLCELTDDKQLLAQTMFYKL